MNENGHGPAPRYHDAPPINLKSIMGGLDMTPAPPPPTYSLLAPVKGGPLPVAEEYSVGSAAMNGQRYVVVQIAGPGGVQFHFLDEAAARTVANAMLSSCGGVVLAPVLPGR